MLRLVVLIGAVIVLLTTLTTVQQAAGSDEASCRMVWMSPSYARIKSFDETHTRFAAKYSLYLYREQDQDPMPDEKEGFAVLDGIPVLFIPGNAGSYRQARSIASETSNLYFGEYQHGDNNSTHFDFFSADFNEDFTAFHGRTLLDQAEYANEAIRFILGLYAGNENPPTAVVVLAHSMGGIVARTMVTLPNYHGGVNTMITLASPHSAAPLTFDGDVLKIYRDVDDFWRRAYKKEERKDTERLEEDKGLEEDTETERVKKDKGLEDTETERVKKDKGLETETERVKKDTHTEKHEDSLTTVARSRLANVSLVSITGGSVDFTLPADYTTLGYLVPPSHGFTVFSTGIPHVWTTIDHLAIVWCAQLRHVIARSLLEIADRNAPERTYGLERRMHVFRGYLMSGMEVKHREHEIQRGIREDDIDRENDTRSELDKDISDRDTNRDSEWSDRGDKKEVGEVGELEEREYLERDGENIGEDSVEKHPTTEYPVFYNVSHMENTPRTVLLYGREISVLSASPHTTVSVCEKGVCVLQQMAAVPRSSAKASSSAFGGDEEPFSAWRGSFDEETYVKVSGSLFVADTKREQHTLTLSPFGMSVSRDRAVCTEISIPFAWSSLLAYRLHIAAKPGPYLSLLRQYAGDEVKWHVGVETAGSVLLTLHGAAPYVPFSSTPHIHLELWSFVDSTGPVSFRVSIAFAQSLKLLVLRYRLAVVAVCTSIVLAVMALQLRDRREMSFSQGLVRINRPRNVLILAAGMFLLNIASRWAPVQYILGLLDPANVYVGRVDVPPPFKVNSYFLGLEEWYLWPLGLVLYSMCTFFVWTVHGVIAGVLSVLPAVKQKKQTFSPRAIAVNVVLMALIAWYLPYQVVYVVALLVQALNVVRSRDSFSVSMLMLMLAVLPVNVPILVVFVHNMTVNWKTPFSSHHNVLSVLPILLMVQMGGRGRLLGGFAWVFVGYCVVYGVRHAFWVHHMLNVFCCVGILEWFSERSESERSCSSSEAR